MDRKEDFAADVFSRDIGVNKGYLYTTNCPLSSQLANRRLTDAALVSVDFQGKRVLDIGCGDGSYTRELFDRGHPASMHGIDLVRDAIDIARQKTDSERITFEVQRVDALPYESGSFDIAHIRGVLHHTDKPLNALREALRVASTVLVIEPNGYNPLIKLLEKFSPYHVRHKERSYAPARLDYWVRQIGGEIFIQKYVGLVPFFCPDWLAKILKLIEPAVEKLPLVNSLGCAVYVFVFRRSGKSLGDKSKAALL